ncbi:Uncharacterised protein [Metamycoplasma arthritidis]|uniref:Conserved hypothetical membrane protein n=1 Tax=Metamycoplasma arthritidis (strain 158L3-1) TaxID=243272 RepID=B3PMS0_META1|nr:hypothetical protein [Metamycoplasma arthritidis]ACF07322.1 conserved hypothetical membrane protein [Metamycoplasma arthritidis 158L3-1]VEU78845.1 Uncharacterised protein [Metamycoplasma arthritidis]
MKKIKLLILGLPLVSLLPLSAISSTTNLRDDPKPTDPKTQDPKSENSKPKGLSPEWGTFKKLFEDEWKIHGKTFLNEIKGRLNKLIEELKSDEKTPLEERLIATYYYRQVLSYFTENSTKILADPFANNFHLNFPRVYSDNKKYTYGKLTYNKKEYAGVIWGEKDPSDYKKAIGNDPKSFVKEKDEDNVLTYEEYKKVVTDYLQGLIKAWESIALNKEDLPNAKKGNKLNIKEIKVGNQTHSIIDVDLPKGFKSWSEYIASCVTTRVIEYDLEHNQKNNEQTPKTPPKPEQPPEIIPEDKPKDFDPSIENVAPLVPRIRTKYLTNPSRIVSGYTSNRSNEYFFFENPINIRFSYTVTSVSQNGNTLKYTVLIKDLVNPEKTRQYEVNEVNNYTLQQNQLDEIAVDAINKQIIKFYAALGVEKNLDYKLIGTSNTLRQALFDMVFVAISLYSNKDYKAIYRSMRSSYINYDLNTKINQEKFASATTEQYFNELRGTKTNDIYFWSHLAFSYEQVYSQLRNSLIENKKTINKIFNETFKAQNMDVSILDKGMRELERSIQLLVVQSKNFSGSANGSYETYVQQLKKVHKLLLSLAALNKKESELSTDTAKKTFQTNYQEITKVLQEQSQNQKTLIKISAAIFIALGLIMLIYGTTMLIKDRTKDKTKKINIALVVMGAIMTAIFTLILAITLGGII